MRKLSCFGLVMAMLLFVLPAPTQADQNGVRDMVKYYTINDGTNFIRSTKPFESGVATQQFGRKKSVTLSINNAPGYADSGFVVYAGNLSELSSIVLAGAGGYGLNLWFDTNNDNEFFLWDASNVMTGLGGDTYGLGPAATGGNLTIDSASTFWMMTWPYGSYTLARLKEGAFPGISGNTHIAIWVGVSGSGSKSATISSITGF